MKRILRFANLLLLLTLLVALSACGGTNSAQGEPPAAPGNAGQTGEGTEEPQPGVQLTVEQVQVFYSDANLEQLLAEQREITYDPQNSDAKYVQALKLLGEPREPGHEPLWVDFAYHAVRYADGTLTIDAAGDNVYNLGSTGEAKALEALKRTMFQFPEVERIVILVDGKPADTLMGHVDISEPLTR